MCIPQIVMYIIIQDRTTPFMSIRVILILTQGVLVTHYACIWNALQSNIEVNVTISKFKMHLQEHSLELKYTRLKKYIMYHAVFVYYIVFICR